MIDITQKPTNRKGRGSKKHGLSSSTENVIWRGMNARCYTVTNPDYPRYGGRGITVCDRWRGENGFMNFLSDMGKRPSNEHSIDRENNNGNYEPNNCKWATRLEQCSNTRKNKWYEYDGKKMIMARWAEYCGVSSHLLWQMLQRKSFPDTIEYYKAVRK